MHRLLFAFVLIAALMVGCSSSNDGAVPSLKGKKRVIAVFAPNAKRAQGLTNAFKSSPGFKERDIAWFVLGPHKIATNMSNTPDRSRLEKLHTVAGFQAVLIGKDGKLIASQLGGLNIQGLVDAISPKPSQLQLKQMQRNH